MGGPAIDNRINEITETFGMSPEVAARAMGITTQTFYNKRNDKLLGHSFNQKNLDKLVAYIKVEAGKL